jgi:hypothetical protein
MHTNSSKGGSTTFYKYNPLDHDQAGVVVNRIQNQILSGIALGFNKHYKINFNYCFWLNDIEYSYDVPVDGKVDKITYFNNAEFIISFIYLMNYPAEERAGYHKSHR